MHINLNGYSVIFDSNNVVSVFKENCLVGYLKVENSTLEEWQVCEIASKIIRSPLKYNDLEEDSNSQMKEYSEWVKKTSIRSLLNELIELHDSYTSAYEDYEIYEESAHEISAKNKLVYLEIVRRSGEHV